MTLPPLTYLSVDSVSEGIGLSQVVRYVERLAVRGVDVTLHSWEKATPDPTVARQLSSVGVRWKPHRHRVGGSAAGLVRVVHGAGLLIGAELVHARSDLAAAAAVVTGRRSWVWDLRAFWREQRLAAGMLRVGSPEERTMRAVEAASARSCTGIVTLSRGAIDVLRERYGEDVAAKSRVITTCVDLDRFPLTPAPEAPPVRALLAGTLSQLYDVPTMLRLVERVRARYPASLTVLTPEETSWSGELRAAGIESARATPAEMPTKVRDHHVGLSVLRFDMGRSSRGATPTKLGEFLSSGRPVVVSAGVGDMDEHLSRYDCGVVITDSSAAELDRGAEELLRLVGDPATPKRCRALAEEHFSLDRGVDELLALYKQATS